MHVTRDHVAHTYHRSTSGLKHLMTEPPAEIRTTIEKTVQYVKKNGVAFEQKLIQNDSDGKFAFLNSSDKYNEYYKRLLEGEAPSAKTEEESNGSDSKKAPHPLLFVTDTPPISSYDLDVIKLTAMYFVSNTQKHTDALQKYMERKGNRSQFAFLNRKHSLHPVYRKYCEQYQAISTASADPKSESAAHIDRLLKSTPQDMFVRAYERAVYEKKHKMDVKARETETRKLQLQYALIDWQDFAFVAKINFDAVDEVSELALPLKREDVMYRALLAKSKELHLAKSTNSRSQSREQEEAKDHEKITSELPNNKTGEKSETDEQTEQKPDSDSGKPKHTVPKGMKIRAAGESRLKRKHDQGGERTITCPISGQQVAELKFDAHLKVLLRDPRYKEQQDNFVRKNFSYASNLTTDQVYENIKRLVNRKTEQENKRVDIGPH